MFSKLKSSLFLGALLALSQPSIAQNASEDAWRAVAAARTLQQWYNRTTGLWETTGWWNSANCLTTLADLVEVQPALHRRLDWVFSNTFVQAQRYNLQMTKVMDNDSHMMRSYYWRHWPHFPRGWREPPVVYPDGFLNEYYDDEGWWALGWIQAYDVTRQPQYLQAAAHIFEDMRNGSTTPCGGIWWSKAQTYVNAISNELYLSVASHLANRMPNKQYYLDIALDQWAWFRASGMINAQNTINDGLTDTCQNNNDTVWSYNQGVILGALVELSSATANATYIPTANAIALAAIDALSDANGILHDPCEPNCGADGAQFKGVFMRNLRVLQLASPDERFRTFVERNADSIWAYDRNARNELSLIWSGPFVSPANASTQSSALDALVAAAAVW